MRSIKYIIAVMALFTVFAITGSAQKADDPILQTLEELADMNKRKDIEIAGLKAQKSISDERLALEKERSTTYMEQRDFYKSAYEKSTKIDTNSALVIDNLRGQVNDYKKEIVDLRHDIDKLERSRTVRTFVAGGLGFAGGYYFGQKSNNGPLFR